MDRLRVLLVDDEEELVATISERLMLRGIEADGVTTGAEALKLARDKEFDVVVLDVKMPGMDGLKVMRKMKQLRSRSGLSASVQRLLCSLQAY